MMNVYCDASVLVTLVLRDEHERAVRRWLQSREHLLLSYSDFGWGELVSAIGSRVRSRHPVRLTLGDRLVIRAAEVVRGLVKTTLTADDVADGTAMVAHFALGLRLPDAIHLAIARRHAATLITTDKKRGDAAAALGIGYVDPTRPA